MSDVIIINKQEIERREGSRREGKRKKKEGENAGSRVVACADAWGG